MKRWVHTSLILFAALWCLAIFAAPIFNLGGLYLFFSIICHQLPDRSWHVQGEQLGLCIRCTSISIGFLVGLISIGAPNVRAFKVAVVLSLAQWLLAVTFLDSEVLRALSGLLLGAMAAPIVRTGVEEMLVSRVRTAHESM